MLLLSPRRQREKELGGVSHTVGGDSGSRYLTLGFFKARNENFQPIRAESDLGDHLLCL